MISGCNKPPSYDETPRIEYNSIKKDIITNSLTLSKVDSITISIRFEDGDADLGINDLSDTASQDNYFVTTYIQKEGSFQEIQFPIEFDAKFGRLGPSNYTGPLDGELNRGLEINHQGTNTYTLNGNTFTLNAGDTLQFEIQIKDESSNFSNTIITDPIIYKL